MCQCTGPSLDQVMVCRLFGAKPLPEPILAYCQLDPWGQITVKFESEFYHFHSRKCIWRMAAILFWERWDKLCHHYSDTGWTPFRYQAIIRTNAALLSIEPSGTDFSDILINKKIFYWNILIIVRMRHVRRHDSHRLWQYLKYFWITRQPCVQNWTVCT